MDKKKEKQSVLQLLFGFMDRANGDHVGAYAAQAAYFLIMSFIPFILFLTTIIRYTPLTYNMVSETIRAFVPHNIQNFVLTIVSEVYGRSTAVVPISAIMALWSAGKAMQSLTNGLNSIYHVHETRNWLITRMYAVVYTFLFSIAIIASLLLLVLGNQTATGLGVEVSKQSAILLGIAIGMSSLCCAVGGGLSFVGLVCPHLARRLTGPNYRSLIGITALLGAVLLVFSDIISRTLLIPNEIPIGIVAAVIGAPSLFTDHAGLNHKFGGTKRNETSYLRQGYFRCLSAESDYPVYERPDSKGKDNFYYRPQRLWKIYFIEGTLPYDSCKIRRGFPGGKFHYPDACCGGCKENGNFTTESSGSRRTYGAGTGLLWKISPSEGVRETEKRGQRCHTVGS